MVEDCVAIQWANFDFLVNLQNRYGFDSFFAKKYLLHFTSLYKIKFANVCCLVFFFLFFLFFLRTPTIWPIVRICNVVNQFLWKLFRVFQRVFHNFRSNAIVKQSIIDLSHYRSKIYASVILVDSEIAFVRKRWIQPFSFITLWWSIYIRRYKIEVVLPQSSLISILLGVFRRDRHLFTF